VSGVLFVTGASRGIGAAVVQEAVRQGWNVALTYVNRESCAAATIARAAEIDAGREVRAWQLDIRSSTDVDRVADEVLQHFGQVNAVVCNAGISQNGMAWSTTDEDWSLVIDTNLTGSFRVCRAFLPELVAQRKGRIVLLSSIMAEGGSGQVAYAASKAGLQGMAATIAKEYGPKGVTTNIVVPGYFETDMTRNGMSGMLSDFALQYCPLRRLGELDEIARTILFLCGDGAGFINGATIPVTGGLDWAP
jgi:NAD(P)-dependent dehydrogenase (short-subunit alcohol dehydrogenase family)